MRKLLLLVFSALMLLLCGCGAAETDAIEIAATTAPVAQFAAAVTEGSGLQVAQVIQDNVSCLHDYTLSVRQMQILEQAEMVIVSGAGLEEMLQDVLENRTVVDCSAGVSLLEAESHEVHEETHDHTHDHDPHIWLDPLRAAQMVQTMTDSLCRIWPEHEALFRENCRTLTERLSALDAYGQQALSDLSCRELITFHDGFAYLAHRYDLEILSAMEEEAGSEASARDLTGLVELVRTHRLPAVFTEINGSPSAASVICRETGAARFALDMAMGDNDYFAAMTANFDTLKEALQ